MNLNEYRKRVVLQTAGLGLAAMAIFALPGILMGLAQHKLFVFALLAFYPLVYIVPQLAKICSWKLTTGTVVDVVLVNDFDQPYTEAHIRYLAGDNQEHVVAIPIKEFDPYEKNTKSLLEKMFQDSRFEFLGTTVPVFCSARDAGRSFAYVEEHR